MRQFYEQFYAAIETSAVHADFCRRAFGLDLGQHGFADLAQLQALIHVTGMGPPHHVLDLGCGHGRCAEYLSDRTGAHVLGLDYIPAAVDSARRHTAAKRQRLEFVVGDINALALAPASLDIVVSIDTLYFSDDLPHTLGALRAALRPGGQMAILYHHGWEPWMPLAEFDTTTLPPDSTPLGQALRTLRLPFTTLDFSVEECRLALHRRGVLEELRPQFEAEGLVFIYDNRMGECQGMARAFDLGLLRRYLYHVRV